MSERAQPHQLLPPPRRSVRRLGLVAAVPEEARAIGRFMDVRQRSHRHRVALLHGSMGGQEISLAWAGMGSIAASAATDCLLETGVDAIAAIGFAGALSPLLQPGDILAATAVIDAAGERWEADAELFAAVTDGAPLPAAPDPAHARCTGALRHGPLLTVPRIAVTAVEKRRLGEETGAAGVDMESGAVLRRAAAAGVPSIALRVITDGVDQDLPLDFNLCCDSHGQLDRARLVRLLIRRPAALAGLIRLGRQSAAAGRSLAAMLGWYVPRLPS